jgi:hypothetical protein
MKTATSPLDIVAASRFDGVTSRELGKQMRTHHGASSGALSALHKDGQIVRLADKRNGQSIYVLPKFARNRTTINRRSMLDSVIAFLLDNDYADAAQFLNEEYPR